MSALLYPHQGAPTGRALEAALGLTPATYHQIDKVIRWGYTGSFQQTNNQLNTAEAISRATNKLVALHIMQEAGVPVPAFSTDPLDIWDGGTPLLGRKTTHTRGNDVRLCLQPVDWERVPRDYYVKYIPKLREFRIHVINGEAVICQSKHLREADGLTKPNAVWNHRAGYVYVTPQLKPDITRREAAIKAVKSLGLDFGAVDIIVASTPNKEHYVLEVNTAPGLAQRTATVYTRHFAAWLGIPETELNFDKLKGLGTVE